MSEYNERWLDGDIPEYWDEAERRSRELERRRTEALWIPRDSPVKPSLKTTPDEMEEEVLIHHNRPFLQQGTVAVGRYVHALDEWRFRNENSDSSEWVIGWRRFPVPEYAPTEEKTDAPA